LVYTILGALHKSKYRIIYLIEAFILIVCMSAIKGPFLQGPGFLVSF